MKRALRVVLLSVILSFIVSTGMAAEILTNDAVVAMVRAGLGEELIIGKIKGTQGQFDLTANALIRLKGAGVSDKIIQTMMEASAKNAPPTAPGTPPAASAPDTSRHEQEAIALFRKGDAAEAVAAFDRLLAQKPDDDTLKIWKARALLDQARAMRESKAPNFKPIVIDAYTILRPLERQQAENPDWNLAMAVALWLNDRAERAQRVAKKVLSLRPNAAEARLLLGDIDYESALASTGPGKEPFRLIYVQSARKAYDAALATPDLPPALRAEACYKLGLVAMELEGKSGDAREAWQRAAAAEPAARYGRMAEQKLAAVPAK
jgi:tetratricopeptide (TPR) repeat protein